ncbi:MAG: hypothetical protein ABJC62_06460 [Frankiaceae bacterium]
MTRAAFRLAAIGLAAGVLATGCSSNNDSKNNSASSSPASAASSGDMSSMSSSASAAPVADAAATPAAALRAGLTDLLDNHVWLAGNALNTAVTKGGNLKDKNVAGAVAALDANSVALSKAIGAAYPAAEKPFLASWRQHIGFFVNYTLGKATKNAKMAAKAKTDLDGYRTGFGQLIHSVVPELPAAAVATELKPHVASLLAAIDASVAKSPTFQSKLAVSAEHMQMTAAVLANGIAKNKKMPGNAMGPASTLRATLTQQLNDHVWLAGNALDTAVMKGGNLKDPTVMGAVTALDGNSVDLSKTLGSVYPAAAKPFLASWRQHIGFFVNYTLGKATKNAKMVAKAKTDLDGYRTGFGQLIHSVVPELPAAAVATELKPHVASLLAAIDASVAKSPTLQSKLSASADHMVMTAAVLAGGIAKNKKIVS